MIISKAAEKSICERQAPFIVKTVSRLGLEENFLKLMSVINEEKPTKIIANIILTHKRPDVFHQIRNKTSMFTVLPLLNNILKGCSQYKEKQRHADWKEQRFSLLADDMP